MKEQLGHMYDQLEASIVDMRRQIGVRPKAVLVVTGHWISDHFEVSAALEPPMLYDYYGFPEHTYHVHYRAPGSPALASRTVQLLQNAGFAISLDQNRGFDHGTFTVLQPLFPEADVPVVQMSIRADFSPHDHFEAGRALAPLREEGVLIIGSGLSYHNLRRMDRSAAAPSREFDAWLQDTLVRSGPGERRRRLTAWSDAPSARIAHPQEDHLLPLMVALGAAEEDPGACVYHEDAFMGSMVVSSFRFGPAGTNATR
jgi:aromatic ring-opening dioxygenase catalytic subunit (LigB family)